MAMKKTVKPVAKVEVKAPAAEVKKVEVKAPVVAPVAAPVVEVKKEEVKKTEVKKVPAKKAEPAKKPAAKKAPAKKEAVKENMYIEFSGKSYTQEDLVKIAKDIWKFDLKKKAGDFKAVELYVKPEENRTYYVINGTEMGSFEI